MLYLTLLWGMHSIPPTAKSGFCILYLTLLWGMHSIPLTARSGISTLLKCKKRFVIVCKGGVKLFKMVWEGLRKFGKG